MIKKIKKPMIVFHLSVECFPVAKVGGLADVVGALPKYQKKLGVDAKVVMPWYNKPFVQEHEYEVVFDGFIHQIHHTFQVLVLKEKHDVLGYELYLVKIPGLLDRDQVYGYFDESQQFIAFQHAVLHWLSSMKIRPDVLHCHDYHTGLVPFMVEHCPDFEFLKGVKTIGTIHNGEYQGTLDWQMSNYMPRFDAWKWGFLDWNGRINPLATMIKCCNEFTAVSQGYMTELFEEAQGLQDLIKQEHQKAHGIINGIDTEVWDPQTDKMLFENYNIKTANKGKKANKEFLCNEFHLNPDLPLYAFIGRFAGEKGADMLPDIVRRSITETQGALNILILGSGNPQIENTLKQLREEFYVNFAMDLGYKEDLSHKIYAGADFLLMPSRVEPCGLNQMYAMRYGTIPIVRYTGGLKDTVADVSSGGYGLNYTFPGSDDAVHAIKRALYLYGSKKEMNNLRKIIMNLDFSWEKSAKNYITLYKKK